MNPIVGLIFAIIAFAVFVISLRSLIRSRQEKKRQQQEQYIRDEDGDRKEMM
jgi:predicted PurR-regulated permease PerM